MKRELEYANEILAKLLFLRQEIAANSTEFRPDALEGVDQAVAYIEGFIAANRRYQAERPAHSDMP